MSKAEDASIEAKIDRYFAEIFRLYGLYWHTWPSEKPERDRKIHIRGRAFGLESAGIARTAPDYHEFKDGDQWLYTEALEKLP